METIPTKQWVKTHCPKCGMICARKYRDGIIECMSTDWIRPCRFYGVAGDLDCPTEAGLFSNLTRKPGYKSKIMRD